MQVLVILHGWQSSKEKWQKVRDLLESPELKVIVPDIPGFKPETELKEPWNLDNYLHWLEDFTENGSAQACGEPFSAELAEGTCSERAKRVEGFFLLGHSFGGRVAIKFAVKYPERLKGLILVSAAGIKKKKTLFDRLVIFGIGLAKKLKIEETTFFKGIWLIFKKVFYCYVLRTTDYLKAYGPLKQTMTNVVNEDLTGLLDKIPVPTLIIWGKNDKMTPLKDAHLMKNKISNSRLEILDNIGHIPHLECPEILTQKIETFVSSVG